MGEDLCLNILTWDRNRKLDWKAGKKCIDSLEADETGEVKGTEGNTYTKKQLHIMLSNVYQASKDGRRDTTVIHLLHLNILVTGGMSWGDDPTDTFTSICSLNEFEILNVVGFNMDEINYKEILLKVLKCQPLQPLLIGIDDELDKMIEKKLKGAK